MQISEELERQEMEATKSLEQEVNEHHEHLEYQHLQIDKVVHESKETRSSESGDEEEDADSKLIVQNFDPYFEEELA